VILGLFFHVNKFFFVIHVLIFLQVMLDQQGLSKGSGFVAFSTPEEASRAVSFKFLFVIRSCYLAYTVAFFCILICYYQFLFSVEWNEWKDDRKETPVCSRCPTQRREEGSAAGDPHYCIFFSSNNYFSLFCSNKKTFVAGNHMIIYSTFHMTCTCLAWSSNLFYTGGTYKI
jgi:hypothetical protein